MSFEETYHVTSQSYERVNHFREWLNQLQGYEKTVIPIEVLRDVFDEFRANRLLKAEDVTSTRIKAFLKKRGHSKWNEHIPQMYMILSGTPPPRMSSEKQAELTCLFLQTLTPFDNIPKSIKKRGNYLTYSYAIYKLCELTDQDDFLKQMPKLKTDNNTRNHDMIWKLICKALNWEFIETGI